VPNTDAQVAVVTAAYTKWQKRSEEYKSKTPGVTKADVDSAYKEMQKAIREWEKPDSSETPQVAKADRKSKPKSWWPKFK
jgi:hypothetical protein